MPAEEMEKEAREERRDAKMATIYEMRLIIANGEKKEYTREELLELFDKIAMAKEQG